MAPEQVLGKAKRLGLPPTCTRRCILYECPTGRPPLKAATEVDTIMQVVSDDPISVRQLQPKCAAGSGDGGSEVSGEGPGPALR